MTRGMPGEERSGESPNGNMKGSKPREQTYARGGEAHSVGKVSPYITCPPSCVLVNFHTWPVIPTLLTPNCLLCNFQQHTKIRN